MDQNNLNTPEITPAPEAREPLPTFAPVQPVPAYVAPAQPQENPYVRAELDACAQESFGKALASAILMEFPIGSIIAIFLGSGALKKFQHAQEIAQQNGVYVGGKNVAARVLAMVGKFGGIAMTAFWGFYFSYMFLIICLSVLPEIFEML